MGAATVSAPAVAAAPSPRRRRSLLGLSAVTALVWVTASDISIALPTIGRDLGGSMDGLLGARTQQVIEDTFRAAVGNAMWLLVAAAAVGIVTSWLLLVRGAERP